MSYLQGDIVLVPFPMTDMSASKPRPAIVVSNKKVNNTQDVILAAITSTLRNDDFSFSLDNKVTTPLRKPCEVRCHKLFTAAQSIIKKKISSLKAGEVKVYEKIKGVVEYLP
jgi:mRNA interferase MazF